VPQRGGARGDDDVVVALSELGRRDLVFEDDLGVGLGQLRFEPADDPGPFSVDRRLGDELHLAAQRGRLLEEGDDVPPLGRGEGGAQPSRSSSDDTHPMDSPRSRQIPEMAFPPDAGIVDARQRRVACLSVQAPVRSHARADVVRTALLDLAHPHGFGDELARHPDHVGLAARDNALGDLGGSDAPDGDHR